MTAAAVIAKSSFVLLQLGRRRFGLPAAIVTELAPPVKLHVFAHQTPMVAGVIVRRGRVIPVYDVTPVLVGKKLPDRRFLSGRIAENRRPGRTQRDSRGWRM